MNKPPLDCNTQDLLEAAIVQKRRLSITCENTVGQHMTYDKVLPIDIRSSHGIEQLTILTTDNEGGILKLAINTSQIIAFSALDSLKPVIEFTIKAKL
ncbi:MAG: hypothetical protein R3E90_01375 [Marinicella sp.]|nr:hypothetical protein [Xanthomonadales bacterium]